MAAWGLIDHRQQQHSTSGWRLAERVCVAIGVTLAIVTGIASGTVMAARELAILIAEIAAWAKERWSACASLRWGPVSA